MKDPGREWNEDRTGDEDEDEDEDEAGDEDEDEDEDKDEDEDSLLTSKEPFRMITKLILAQFTV